jgi:hypothetical protein
MIREFDPAGPAGDVEPYRAAEVARHRARPYADVGPVRRELLRRIEAAAAR